MKPNRSNPLFARYLAMGITSFVLCTSSGYAANYQWDQNNSAAGLGGTGTWDTTNTFWDLAGTGADDGTDTTVAVANWNPTTAVDTAIFGGTTGTLTLASGVNVRGTTFSTSGYVLNLTNTAATNYKLGTLTGNTALNVTLGTGTTTADFVATDWSGFSGTLNVGVSQAVGAGKVAIGSVFGSGLSSAATVNVTANSTLYTSTFTTHAAPLTLNGGDTGETLGQLRLDASGTWSGPITLASPMIGTDSFIGTNSGTSLITGTIGETGGAKQLSKSGGGTTVLSGANTYSGGTILRNGTLAVTSIGNVAAISSSLGASGTFDIAANATLDYWGIGETTDRLLTFSTASGGVVSNNGAGPLVFSTNMTAASAAMGVTFTGGGAITIGSITGNTNTLNFNKTGPGNLTVNGNVTSSATASNIRPQGGVLSFTSTATTTTNSTIISQRSAGGILRLASGASIKTNADANTNGIMGGWALFDNNDWAQVNGAGTAITAYTGGYVSDTWASTNNTDVTTSSAPTSGSTTNSLRFNTAGANVLTLSGVNIINTGGILLTPSVGANNTQITGGTLVGANSKDLVIHQFNTGGTLSIGSIIANNTAATALTVAGPGTTILTGASTYTGTTYVLDGAKLTVNANSGAKFYQVASGAILELGYSPGTAIYGYGVSVYGAGTSATSGLYLAGGMNFNFQSTLTFKGAPSTVRGYGTGNALLYGYDTNGVNLSTDSSASGSIIDSRVDIQSSSFGYVMTIAPGLNTATGDLTVQGLIKGSLHHIKKGDGSVKLTGASPNTSAFEVWAGSTILSGGANRLGSGSSVVLGNSTGSGRLVLDGVAQTLTALTTSGTGTGNAVVGGSATLSTLTINNGSASTLAATVGGKGTNENNLALVKSGVGTLTINGTNTYTGGTTVNAGTLKLDYSTVDGSKLADSSVLSLAGGTLDLAGGTHTEVVASTVLSGTGAATITRSSGAAVISLGNITRTSTGTLNLVTGGIAKTTLTNDLSGKLPAWITVNGQAASNDGSGNIIAYVRTYSNVNRLGGTITSNPYSNVQIVNGGSSGNVTPLVPGLTEIDTLLQSATDGPATVELVTGDILRLGPLGALTVPTGAGALTIQGGSLSAGGAADTSGVITFDNEAAVTVSSEILDNGTGLVSLVKTGTGALELTTSNSFTGGITLQNGALRIKDAQSLGYNGTLTINGGTLDNTSGAAIIIGDTIPQVWNADINFLGSSDLQFGPGAVTLGANRIVNVANSTLGIGGALNGAFNLTKTGAGTLVLAGGNWTGLTTVSAGTLEVKAKTNDVTYAVAQGASLKLGYTSGGGYTPGITFNGNGVADSAGLYLKTGVTFQTNGGLLIQTAPTTIRTYDTGSNAAIQGFDANSAYFIKTTTDASGSVVNSDINVYTGSYGYRLVTDAGANTAVGDLTIHGVISGTGSSAVTGESIATSLHKYGSGSLRLTNASTFSQGTSISAGSIILSSGDNRLPVGTAVALGNGTASGRLVLDGISQTVTDILGNGTGTDNRIVGGSVTPSTLAVNYTGAGRTFAGFIGGSGTNENNLALVKSGTGTLTLTGANTYAGNTTVNAGTLSVSTPFLANASDVLITTGATLDLTTATTDTIDELILDGSPQPAGVYGAVGSGAQFERSYITGTGTLTVTTGPAGGYDSWLAGFTFPGGADTTRTGDPDGDGFTNLQEFLFGTSPVAGNGSLATTSVSGGTLTIRWKQRLTGGTYRLMESATLANPWTLSGATPTDDGAAVGDYQPRKADVTIGAGKDFFRVEGVEN